MGVGTAAGQARAHSRAGKGGGEKEGPAWESPPTLLSLSPRGAVVEGLRVQASTWVLQQGQEVLSLLLKGLGGKKGKLELHSPAS